MLLGGIAAARANPALIAARWAGDLVAAALTAVGLLAPPAALFGPGFAGRFARLGVAVRSGEVELLAIEILDLTAAVAAAPGRLAAGLGAALALWTLALAVYCWVQGGVYGVLLAADRAAGGDAPAGSGGPAAAERGAGDRGPAGSVGPLGSAGPVGSAVRPGAAFSFARFAAAGRRLFWRYFWFVNLYATALGLVVLCALLPLTLVPPAPASEPPLAALAVAAATLPPAALASAAIALWYAAGRAELAREGSGVRTASRRAVDVLGRRPGPVIAVGLLAAGAALAVAGTAAPLVAALALLPAPAALAGNAVLTAVQWLAAAIAATAHGGAMVRLVRAEFPPPAALEAAA